MPRMLSHLSLIEIIRSSIQRLIDISQFSMFNAHYGRIENIHQQSPLAEKSFGEPRDCSTIAQQLLPSVKAQRLSTLRLSRIFNG